MKIIFKRTKEYGRNGGLNYVWTIRFIPNPTPVTASFEDDMIAIAREHGTCFDFWTGGAIKFARSRELHRWAVYRWYRAMLRLWTHPRSEPAVFGQVENYVHFEEVP